MNIKKTLAITSLFFITYYLFNNLLSPSMISGTYINVNYKESPFLSSPDTLILAADNTFYSKRLGYGSYEINYISIATIISFSGRENMNLNVNRTWSGNPKTNGR